MRGFKNGIPIDRHHYLQLITIILLLDPIIWFFPGWGFPAKTSGSVGVSLETITIVADVAIVVVIVVVVVIGVLMNLVSWSVS